MFKVSIKNYSIKVQAYDSVLEIVDNGQLRDDVCYVTILNFLQLHNVVLANVICEELNNRIKHKVNYKKYTVIYNNDNVKVYLKRN